MFSSLLQCNARAKPDFSDPVFTLGGTFHPTQITHARVPTQQMAEEEVLCEGDLSYQVPCSPTIQDPAQKTWNKVWATLTESGTATCLQFFKGKQVRLLHFL